MDKSSTNKNKLVHGLIAISLLLVPYSLLACTAFAIKKDKQIYLAKNLDWEISNGIVLVNKKGVYKTAYSKKANKLTWVSKYGSVTFNQFGKEFPLGGMNEKGLVIEELNSWGETPKSDNKYELNEFQWTQFCLDNFANTEELLTTIDSIVIVPLFINLHYLISDSKGNIAIIEFYNGKTYIYKDEDIPYPVLSNNHYESSLKYVSNFNGFGGNMEIRPENTSNDRFVKVASVIKMKEQMLLDKKIVFKTLDYVSQEDTQWSIVYDISNKSIHFKTSQNKTIKTIELNEFDFTCKTLTSFIDINNDEIVIAETSLKKLEPNDNENLVIDVFEKYKYYNLGELSKVEFLKLVEYGNSISCK
ncbi:MAG: linear amide C-N hydrolase [Bacteroidota bacterium]